VSQLAFWMYLTFVVIVVTAICLKRFA